jgi:hypothetical protein
LLVTTTFLLDENLDGIMHRILLGLFDCLLDGGTGSEPSCLLTCLLAWDLLPQSKCETDNTQRCNTTDDDVFRVSTSAFYRHWRCGT